MLSTRSLAQAVLLGSALLFAGCPAAGLPDGGACVPGTDGCPCATGDRCSTNDRGEQLVCQGGVCETMSCTAGNAGCACRSGSICNDASATCTKGFCVAGGCLPGQANCGCLAGGCDLGLTCLEGTLCVDAKGYEGGACLDGAKCYRGNRCDTSTGLCAHCDPGTAGCACNANNACNAGLACNAGQCLSAAQLPPANPHCYTYCASSFTTDDGGTQVCGADQLYEGCLPSQTCTQGSCLGTGQAKPTCASDLDCPMWQVCLTGGCYSNCDVNADCSAGQGCFRHACRPTCTVAASNTGCGAGLACTSDDGQNGYCSPVGHASAAASTPPSGGLAVPSPLLELSNVKTSASFAVVPSALGVQDVTVRKLWHEVTSASGQMTRVDAPLDSTGNYRACDPARNECPLAWLSLAAPGGMAQQAPSVSYRLLPGCVDPAQAADGGTACGVVQVTGAGGNTMAVKWSGELEVSAKDARVRVRMEYVQRPDGQWVGSMFYFGTFDDTGLEQWKASPNKSTADGVKNGLLQRWGALRLGMLNGWEEFRAVLTSTREGSYQYTAVKGKCPLVGGTANSACYPFSNMQGVRVYVGDQVAYPIPSGVTELPLAMNLQVDATTPTQFAGRVVSSTAMHYPGNPAVRLELAANPTNSGACFAGGGTDCLVFLKDLSTLGMNSTVNRLVSSVGGRYLSSTGTCTPGYKATLVPWLVPGFAAGSDDAGMRTECRDAELPFDASGAPGTSALNQSLSGGNPVPDGYPRERTLTFLDGALVNQSELFLLFEESYRGFIPGQLPTKAYGYIILKRAPATLAPGDFEGLKGPATTLKTPPVAPGATCDAQLMTELMGGTLPVSQLDKVNALDRLLNGAASTRGTRAPQLGSAIAYYCEDTGLFNGGPDDLGTASSVRVPCPAGSKVTYFNVCADAAGTNCSRTPAALAAESCQRTYVPDADGRSCTADQDCHSGICDESAGRCVRATCGSKLAQWKSTTGIVYEGGSDTEPLFYQCTQSGQVFCDDNRQDLRADKTFFRKSAVPADRSFVPLRQLIDAAFRYKTRFRSSVSGTSLGFAPQRCVPNSDAIPYCYDPAQIEEARKRVDCVLSLYNDTTFFNALDAPTSAALQQYLLQDFSQQSATKDGFERLYAELAIMLGDEALTAAYGSRFDLASSGGATFKGSAFEPNGIDLTGVAGAEMFNLYQSVQYYQLALDRMYALGPNLQTSLGRSAASFITDATVTNWLARLVRAASQKSRAWGEVAKRYQNFNRPDLARRVIERAYVATYLESALISRLMLDITQKASSASVPQLRVTLTNTQRNYRMALLDMRGTYDQITDQMNFFGYAPDYIPFPALDASSTSSANAYEVISLLSKQRLDLAKTREQVALTFGKQGKVDAAQFQSDLVSVRNNYENQLANMCGTFTGDDGVIYPATRKYAGQSPAATAYGDPCGRMGNGDLFNSMGNAKDAALKMQGVLLRHENLLREIDNERGRVATVCHAVDALAKFQFATAGRVADMQQSIDNERAYMTFASGVANAAIQALGQLESPWVALSIAATGASAAGATLGVDLDIANQERDIKDYERSSVRMATQLQCVTDTAASTAKVADLFNQTLETKLEALRAQYGIQLALAEVAKLANNAQRLQAQQEEAEQLAVDIQAAANDPNVRIYQNDSIINADVSFNAAISAAYRLTRVYEYYTSTSYAKKEQLFLIRMVTAGQYNLENYLLELDNAFNAFEEQYGNPDLRVLTLSLRDDILKVPYTKTDKTPYSENDRINLLRERLRDVRLLDGNGYLTIPFSTDLASLSPVTRNHKVRHVEVDLQGVKLGDSVAHVYLRMSGTGVVRDVSDQLDYFVFPSRLAVLNASLLGAKVFDPEVYRNYRFRDRPLVNTMWELVINQRDEQANRDIDLQTLTDLRLIIYYSDVTAL